ncbi:hypothetical protein AAVH_15023 [Aphelenchoides avenae]|nr:hypothetical protein AAVH_15023 [Aphelenchus avenae]
MLPVALVLLVAGGCSFGTASVFETVMDVAIAKNPASTELVRRIVQATFEGHETRYITDMRSVIRTLLGKCFVGKFLIIEEGKRVPEGSHYRITNVNEDVIKLRSQVHWSFRKTYPWWSFWRGHYKVEIHGQFCDRERFRNRRQCDAAIAKAGSLIEVRPVVLPCVDARNRDVVWY